MGPAPPYSSTGSLREEGRHHPGAPERVNRQEGLGSSQAKVMSARLTPRPPSPRALPTRSWNPRASAPIWDSWSRRRRRRAQAAYMCAKWDSASAPSFDSHLFGARACPQLTLSRRRKMPVRRISRGAHAGHSTARRRWQPWGSTEGTGGPLHPCWHRLQPRGHGHRPKKASSSQVRHGTLAGALRSWNGDGRWRRSLDILDYERTDDITAVGRRAPECGDMLCWSTGSP
jgi:hypothetical protein